MKNLLILWIYIFWNLKLCIGYATIRRPPCSNKDTGEKGVCTFTWSCSNLVHVGPCVDRSFVGSCCKIPIREDTTVPPYPFSQEYSSTLVSVEKLSLEIPFKQTDRSNDHKPAVHDLRQPVILHPLHSERKPVLTDSQHDQRTPAILHALHSERKPGLTDSQHNQRTSVLLHPLHSERKPVLTDSHHNQRKPVISDGSHDLRWPVLEEDSHDQRLPVVNWFHQSLSHLLQVSTVKQGISKIQQFTSQGFYPKTNLPLMKESNVSTDFSSFVRSSISPHILGSRPTTPAEELSLICGRSLGIGTKRRFKRVVGGRKSEFQRWPWMISLRHLEGKSFRHTCGAVLLNRLWAVTAAHCIDGKSASEIALRLGPVEQRGVREVVVHPAFDPVSFESDLALLRLATPSDAVPVCLPTHQLPDITGRWAVVTGWGRLAQEGELPESLHEVLLPILANNECERMFAEAGYIDTIRDVFVCAGVSSGGIDACEGDSGGPMVVQGDQGEWILVGLTSWGKGCAAPKKPGVYTRMSLFTDWIYSVLTEI